MSNCFLLLGTNLGDKETNLRNAINAINVQIGDIITKSSIYSTAAWGKENQDDFLNQVVKMSTDKSPDEVLRHCLLIEKELGRVRFEKWGARLIDIDVLYYDQVILDTEDLKIPHPQIQNRRFTIVPLIELEEAFIHPVLNKTQIELLEDCQDELEVSKI